MATLKFDWNVVGNPYRDPGLWERNVDRCTHERTVGTREYYLGACTCHRPDTHESLMWSHDPFDHDHPILFHCRAGCSPEDVVQSLLERETHFQKISSEEPESVTPPITPTIPAANAATWAETMSFSPIAIECARTGASLASIRDNPDLPLAEDAAQNIICYVFPDSEGPAPGAVYKWRKVGTHDFGWVNAPTPAPPFWPPPSDTLDEEFVSAESESDTFTARHCGFRCHALTCGASTPLDESVAEELHRRGVKKWVLFYDDDSAGHKIKNTIIRIALEAGIIPIPVDLSLLANNKFLGGFKDLRDYRRLLQDPKEAHTLIREAIRKSEDRLDKLIPSFEDAYENRAPDPGWLVEDIVTPGCITILAAKPGAGKSTVIMAYASAARTGRPLLNKAVHPHRILIATEEGVRSLWKKREAFGSMRHCRLHSVDMPELDDDWSEQVRIMGDVARRHKCDTIVIDTLFSYATPENSDSADKVRPIFKRLRSLTRQGFAVLVTMHGRKNSAGSGHSIDQIAGSILIPGEADIVLELSPSSDGILDNRSLSWVKSRMNPDIVVQPALTITLEGDHLVILDDGTGKQTIQKRLLDYIGDNAWHTTEDIASFLGITQDDLRRPLEKMCKEKSILREKCDGTNGRRGTWRYRLERPLDLTGLAVK